MTGTLQEECVTEIRCNSTKGFGSGYLIRPDLVLTARHVISAEKNLPPPADVEVRPLADAKAGRDWRRATIAWPKPNEWSRLSDIDLALVEIKPDEYTRTIARVVPLGWRDIPQNRRVEVTAVGFPRFKWNEVENTRDSYQLFGDVAPLSSYKGKVFEIEYKGRAPKPLQDWRGISGAALFAEERLIGVVTFKVENGDVDFKAARMDAARDDATFKSLIGGLFSAPTRSSEQTDPITELLDLVCLVDRDPQETQFGPLFSKLLGTTPSRPFCCIIVGENRHGPDELVTRFAVDTIPRLRKRPQEPTEFRPIAWPRRVSNPASELTVLRRLLWNFLAEPDEDIPTDALTFVARLEDESRPHLFRSEIAGLCPNQALLLSSWLTFWSQLSSSRLARPPAHLIVAKDTNAEVLSAWLATVSVPPGVELCPLPELDFCFWQDLSEWIHKRVKVRRPTLGLNYDELRVELEEDLEERLNGTTNFSVLDLKQAIRRMSKRRQNLGALKNR